MPLVRYFVSSNCKNGEYCAIYKDGINWQFVIDDKVIKEERFLSDLFDHIRDYDPDVYKGLVNNIKI